MCMLLCFPRVRPPACVCMRASREARKGVQGAGRHAVRRGDQDADDDTCRYRCLGGRLQADVIAVDNGGCDAALPGTHGNQGGDAWT